MRSYKVITWTIKTNELGNTIIRTDDNGKVWNVPEAPGNRHYEEYLEWVADGNTAEVVE